MADAADAYAKATANGAIGKLEPTTLRDEASSTEQVVSEVHLYGDVVLRFVSGAFQVGIVHATSAMIYDRKHQRKHQDCKSVLGHNTG